MPHINCFQMEQVQQLASDLVPLCSNLILSLSFMLSFAMYLANVTPAFAFVYDLININDLAGSILPYLQQYLTYIQGILDQTNANAAADIIPNLSPRRIVIILQFLAPVIETMEHIFGLLERIVSHLDANDSTYFTAYNNIWENMREIGNDLIEIYRALERAVGITIDQSRISEQWFEG